MRHRPTGLQAVWVIVAALLLCLPAWWNGHPFMYPDTPTYLRGAEMGVTRALGADRLKPWLPAAPQAGAPAAPSPSGDVQPAASLTSVQDKVVLAGRSVYYGMLLYLGFLAGGLGLAVAAQALCVAYVLHLVMVRLWRLSVRSYLLTVGALAVATPLGVFTGLLMPDVFTGITVLAIGVLAVHWPDLARTQRWVLAALLLFALASHSSHLPLALAMIAAALAARWAWGRWRGLSLPGLGVAAACLLAAFAAEAAFNLAVTRFVGAPPMRLPHLTGRLIDMGPGTDYLRKQCPQAGYAACKWVSNYPTLWDDFLFSTDPRKGAFALADAATKRRLSDEQLRLAWAVLRHDPAGVVGGVAADVVRQVGLFETATLRTDQLAQYAGRVPDEVFAAMRSMRSLDNHAASRILTIATYLGTAAGLLLLAWIAWRGTPPGRDFPRLAALVLLGVLANAAICAALASPLERFQARVIWLVPFLAIGALALAARPRLAATPVAPLSTS